MQSTTTRRSGSPDFECLTQKYLRQSRTYSQWPIHQSRQTRVTGFWHKQGLQMTKTELQSALAEATQTGKRTAEVFLDTLGVLAYKEIKKER